MSEHANVYIDKMLKWIEAEYDFDKDFYHNELAKLSLKDRKKKGFVWYPVEVKKTGFTFANRVFVIITQTTTDADSVENFAALRAGKAVVIYSNGDEEKEPIKGVIQYMSSSKMKVVLNNNFLPDWVRNESIVLESAFDDRTFRVARKALLNVKEAKNNRLAELREVLLADLEPSEFHSSVIEDKDYRFAEFLNDSQVDAIKKSQIARDYAIIHGPPGTGKTTTLVHLIKRLVMNEGKVLVCAPSNTAVDVLATRCAKLGLNTVRIGNLSRIDEDLIPLTLDYRLSNHEEANNIKKIKIEAANYRREIRKWKRNFNKEQAEHRKHLRQQVKLLDAWAKQVETQLLGAILNNAQVIVCTLVGASQSILSELHFKTVVIDEAGQSIEAIAWVPILKAERVILSGDPYQLPPTIKTHDRSIIKGLSVSILERLLKDNKETSFLNTQYRMHGQIMEFSNQQFYNGRLMAHDSVVNNRVSKDPDNLPIVFIDTVGTGFEEKQVENSKSKFNPDEGRILREHLYQFIALYVEDEIPNIVILSPYDAQVRLLKSMIYEDEKLEGLPIKVKTIDSFQGQESDVIYISLVRSNVKNEIGFLKDYRRMNVAMTRARKKLIVIGDSGTLASDSFYQSFLEYIDQVQAYKTAWEYIQYS